MKKAQNMKLKVIPIGGLGLIGMNITAFEYNDSIIIVDCGMAFPENDMLGIDVVIPDVTYLKDNIDKVKGMVFTHGHEDHIGALPYILRELNVPLYATKLTMGLIERKAQGRKAGTVDQFGRIPDRVYQDEPQYSGCSRTGDLFSGRYRGTHRRF